MLGASQQGGGQAPPGKYFRLIRLIIIRLCGEEAETMEHLLCRPGRYPFRENDGASLGERAKYPI
jgi:hypothetical protein